MGQPQTEHTPCCMQEEEALPAWKTYKRRTRDERSREKRSSPQRRSGNFLLAQTLCRQIAEEEEGRRWQRISKKRDAGGREKGAVRCIDEMVGK